MVQPPGDSAARTAERRVAPGAFKVCIAAAAGAGHGRGSEVLAEGGPARRSSPRLVNRLDRPTRVLP